ncbi:MAG: N-acetylmuramoyl-L-alanine amidase [Verrucomicrobiaceae bacterium]
MLGGIAEAKTYTVRPSETLYSIALRNGVKVDALMKANRISDARKLQVGQRLSIPSGSSTSSRTTTVSKPTRKSMRVVLDPGHGGKDKGAYWYGVRESDLNMKVAVKAAAGLKQRGYEVIMTRKSDVFLSLSKRAQVANRYRDSIFISIHFNATPNTRVRGAETFYAGGKKGYYLASAVQKSLVRRLKLVDRGARVARYTVLTETKAPAILVECGFISNAAERARCKTSWYQTACAQAIVDGVEKYDRAY